jgi:hypothetical protein
MTDYFFNFKKNLYEAQEEPVTGESSDMEKILTKSPKVTSALTALLTSQKEVNQKAQDELRDVISDIKVIQLRPTTFRIVFKNSNYFDLIYDPSPLEVKNEKDYNPIELFRVAIVGKRYDLANKSSFEQALDYIGQCMKFNPIDSNNPDTQQANTEDGDTTDLPDEIDKPAA